MKKILITGGAGFVGYHLANRLSENLENDIILVDNLQSGQLDIFLKNLIEKKNVKFFNIDLCNIRNLRKNIWTFYDQIYHLAAIVGVEYCMKYPETVLDVNVKSMFNIIELMKENKCGKILFSSSSENYAGGYQYGILPIPTTEDVPLTIKDVFNPRWSYAISKIIGEQLVIHNSKNIYFYSIVRYHNIFGPRMGYKHVIPEVIRRVFLKEEPFKVYGSNQTRTFCYIDDCIDQTIAVMNCETTKGEIINVGNDLEEFKIIDIVNKIFQILNYKVKIELVDGPKGSVERRSPDLSKVRKFIKFSPLTKFEFGIRKTVEWYKKNFEKDKSI